MLPIMTCEKCHNIVKARLLRGFVHIQCECGCEYELEATSLKYYMFIPFIAVFSAVSISKQWIITQDLFIKLVFILCVSYGIHVVICMLLVKLKLFKYSERVGDNNE